MMNKPVLFCLDVSVYSDKELYEESYSKVPQIRKDKIDSFVFDKDKYLSLGAGRLLKHAFSCFGINDYVDRIIYNEYEKPLLKDGSVFFNLSHSGQWVICAMSDEVIGCDIEKIAPIEISLANMLEDSEYIDIMSQEEELREDMLYRFWTLKESFMKAVGLGVNLDLRDFRISLGDKISVQQNIDNKEYHFREITEIGGYKCALCSQANLDKLIIKTLDLH